MRLDKFYFLVYTGSVASVRHFYPEPRRASLLHCFMRPRPASLSKQARPPRPRQWSYHQTGILPPLKFFVSHSYENCRGVGVFFPNRNANFSANQFPAFNPFLFIRFRTLEAQRAARNPFAICRLRTLCHSMGGGGYAHLSNFQGAANATAFASSPTESPARCSVWCWRVFAALWSNPGRAACNTLERHDQSVECGGI
jgi:hypothetical protein